MDDASDAYLIRLAETGSTMDDARQLATELHHEHLTGDVAATRRLRRGVLITAERQTIGRGTQGRRWASPDGALMGTYFSLLPTGPVAELIPPLTLRVALGLAEQAERWAGRHASDRPLIAIKWPNDLLIDGRKLAGVLIELGTMPAPPSPTSPHAVGGDASTSGTPGQAGLAGVVALIGVGLNANNPAPRLADGARPAASLIEYAGGPIDLDSASRDLATILGRAAASAATPLQESELARLASRLYGRGQRVAFVSSHADPSHTAGVVRGIAGDGALLLDAAGSTIPIRRSAQIQWETLGLPDDTDDASHTDAPGASEP